MGLAPGTSLINVRISIGERLPFLAAAENLGTEFTLVLAFGTPSYLEACCLLGGSSTLTRQCEDVAALASSDPASSLRACQKLSGIHKLAVPLPEPSSEDFADSITFPSKNFNFSLSPYCLTGGQEEHDALSEELLLTLREAGLRKANLIRSHSASGPDLRSDRVVSRSAMDFIVYRNLTGGYSWGVTVYVPDAERFRGWSVGRPFTTSDISLSPRLADLLVNVAGLSRGQLLLDPFCGSGTILGNALLHGVDCIGLDRNHGRVEQTKRNLAWLVSNDMKQQPPRRKPAPQYSVQVGDATGIERSLGGKLVDAVVSEPILIPRISSPLTLERARRLVKNSSRIYSDALYSLSKVVRSGGRIILVTPSLRTLEGKEVSVSFENLEEASLEPFQPPGCHFEYPMRVEHQSTRWIRRMVYALQKK